MSTGDRKRYMRFPSATTADLYSALFLTDNLASLTFSVIM